MKRCHKIPLDPLNNQVYIDIVDGHVIVPQIVFQKTIDEPKSSEDALLSNAVPTVTGTVSTKIKSKHSMMRMRLENGLTGKFSPHINV